MVPIRRLPIQIRRLSPSSIPSAHFFECRGNAFHCHGTVGIQAKLARIDRPGCNPVTMREDIPPGRSLDIKSFPEGGNQHADHRDQPQDDNQGQDAIDEKSTSEFFEAVRFSSECLLVFELTQVVNHDWDDSQQQDNGDG